ncbi:MAG: hypothetical protein IPK39_05885 [Sulfuritalea sp.]|nr:hypothetical protein [Sulfuritalea sp.]
MDEPKSALASDMESLVASPGDPDSGAPQASQSEQAAAIVASHKNPESQNDFSLVGSSDEGLIATPPTATQLPRGPPGNGQISSSLVAEESINNNALSPSDSPLLDDGGLFAFPEVPFSEPTGDALPRAPPAPDALIADKTEYLRSESSLAATAQNSASRLTDQALAPVLEHALRIWETAGIDGTLAGRFANLQFRIADLPEAILGETVGNQITIDPDATGHGWFVDATPADSAEFGIALANQTLLADAGSDAFGRIDLLTALVHEIGHVLGFDHDAGLVIMGASLAAGQRVNLASTLQSQDGTLPVAGALIRTGNTLVADDGIDTDPITFTIVNHGGDAGIPDVLVSGSGSADGTYDDIATIIGRVFARDSVVLDINADATWRLTGPDAGILTVAAFSAINFVRVENLTGAAGSRDSFIFEAGGSISGQVDGRTGTVVIGGDADGDSTPSQSGQVPAGGVIQVGDGNSAERVEIGDAGTTTILNQSLVIFNPAPGGEVFVRGNIVAAGNAGLTILGSGHTTTIGPGTTVTTVLPGTVTPTPTATDQAGTTTITVAGDLTINDAVVLGGNAAITATAGNVRITNPGTINGSVADQSSLTITTTGSGTVTLDGAIGANVALKDLIINAAGDVVITGAVKLAGRLAITSGTGKVTLNGAVSATGSILLQASGADGTITLNQAVQSSNANISVLGGKDVLQGAAGNISTGGTSTIDVEATAGSITMAGGSLAQTTGGNIRYKAGQNVVIAQLDARKAGDRAATTIADQANWGKVNVIATSGSMTDAAATANVFGSAARLRAGIGVGSADSSIALEVITVSAAAGSGGINLNDATDVAVDVVNQVAFNRVQANGTISTIQEGADQSDLATTSNGNIALRTTDGGIVINDGTAPADSIGISANGSGTVTLQAKGANQSITLNTRVKSGTGSITVQAPLMVMNPSDLVTSGTISILTGASVFDVNLSGAVEWISQGPIQTTGGQIQGMDEQGKPVSGAIQAIAVDPNDPKVVYVASVNGGVWKTSNINATKLVEFNDPSKASGPDVSGVLYSVSDAFAFTAALDATPGNDGSGKFDPIPAAAVTAGGGPAAKASATLGSVVNKNMLVFTAAVNGAEFNGVSITLVDILAAAGGEIAHYDVASKTLVVFIKKGASTANQIMDAVNKAGELTNGNAGSGATASAIMKAVSATTSDAGSGYAVGNTLTLAGGTFTQATVVTVEAVKVVGVASIANAGTGYAVGDIRRQHRCGDDCRHLHGVARQSGRAGFDQRIRYGRDLRASLGRAFHYRHRRGSRLRPGSDRRVFGRWRLGLCRNRNAYGGRGHQRGSYIVRVGLSLDPGYRLLRAGRQRRDGDGDEPESRLGVCHGAWNRVCAGQCDHCPGGHPDDRGGADCGNGPGACCAANR